MKLLIAGSRTINTWHNISNFILFSRFHDNVTEILTGLAKGVDTLGKEYAEANEIKFTGFPADWDKHGKSAGYKRNVEMVNYCDCAIIIWDGESKGTEHTINLLKKAGKPFELIILKIESYNCEELNV